MTILWALLIGGGLIFLGAVALLPSTKRGNFDLEEYRRAQERREQEEAAAATRAATRPVTQPATRPAERPAGPLREAE